MDRIRLSKGLAEGGYVVQRQTLTAVLGYDYYLYQNRDGTVILMRVNTTTGDVDYAICGVATTKTELDAFWTAKATYTCKPYYNL